MNKKKWQYLAIGLGIGILFSIITQLNLLLFFSILSAIGAVIGGSRTKKWRGAVIGGAAAVTIVPMLFIGLYWLLLSLGVPLAQ